MTFSTADQSTARYYRLTVARGHLGRGKTEFEAVYVRTRLDPVDLMLNRGKPIASIKRVVELRLITRDQFYAAADRGENCFAAVVRRPGAAACPSGHTVRKARRARRYEINRRRKQLQDAWAW